MGLGQLLVGPLADAVGRRRPLIAGLALHIAASVFCAFAPTIELHLLDWSGDIYGDHVRVEVVDRIRDIRPFPSVEALIDAIRGDERDGRTMLRLEAGG